MSVATARGSGFLCTACGLGFLCTAWVFSLPQAAEKLREIHAQRA